MNVDLGEIYRKLYDEISDHSRTDVDLVINGDELRVGYKSCDGRVLIMPQRVIFIPEIELAFHPSDIIDANIRVVVEHLHEIEKQRVDL